MHVEINIHECCPPRRRDEHTIRMIPTVGVVSEQSGPVAPTPQHQSPRPIEGVLLMAQSITDSQQVTLGVKFLDKKGQPAKVDGVPVWLTDNSEVLALTPAADGLSCLVKAVGPLGTAKVSMTADADLGAGVIDLVGVEDVTVTAGQATVVSITAGPPEEQP